MTKKVYCQSGLDGSHRIILKIESVKIARRIRTPIMRYRGCAILGMPLAAAAFSLGFSFQGSHEHGRGTTYPAVHGYGLCGTIQLACPAFHALRLTGYFYDFPTGFKYRMGTYIKAHPASIAEFRLESQRIFCIGI